jgi:hypothetical protein
MTNWGHWLLLHPESTAYNLFDGKRYPAKELSWEPVDEAMKSIGRSDARLEAMSPVLGVEGESAHVAFVLAGLADRDVITASFENRPVMLFWYKPTESAVVFFPIVDGRTLTFFPDEISPSTAPFKDRETGTRWSLAGRGIDGPLRGKELTWIPSIQCRWFAWSAEYPTTELITKQESSGKAKAPK